MSYQKLHYEECSARINAEYIFIIRLMILQDQKNIIGNSENHYLTSLQLQQENSLRPGICTGTVVHLGRWRNCHDARNVTGCLSYNQGYAKSKAAENL